MPALRGTAFNSDTGGSSISVVMPTGFASGDVCLVFITVTKSSNGAAVGSLTGFSDSGDTAGSNTAFHARAYAKVLDGSESGLSVTYTGNLAMCTVACYSGAANFDPTSIAAPVYANSGTVLAAPSITLANSGDWIGWFACSTRNGSLTPGTPTVPSGFTSQYTSSTITNGATCSAKVCFGDLETAQSSGAYSAPNGSVSGGSFPSWTWNTGIQLGGGTTTVNLTTPNLALGSNAVTPQVSETVSLGTPNLALAAQPVTPGQIVTVALNTAALNLAAQPITPECTVQTVSLTTATLSLAAPALALQTSSSISLGTANAILAAAALNPVTVQPNYTNPWYGNALDPLDSDFQGPNVP